MELHVSATFQKYGNMWFRPVLARERLEQLWGVYRFLYKIWSYAIDGNMVTRKQEQIEWRLFVDTVGIRGPDFKDKFLF